MAKLPSSNLSNYQVAKAIGVGSLNVTTLCQSDKISKWSEFKPVHRANYFGVKTAEMMAEARYGLIYPQIDVVASGNNCVVQFPGGLVESESVMREKLVFRYEVYDSVEGTGQLDSKGNFYGKPSRYINISNDDGSETVIESPCHLDDFANYDHNSIAPFYSKNGMEAVPQYDESGMYLGTTYRLTINVRRPSDTYGGLTANTMVADYDRYPTDKLSDWKLCVVLYNRTGSQMLGVMQAVNSIYHEYYNVGETDTEFVFEMDESYINKLSRYLAKNQGLGQYAVIPLLAKSATMSTSNTVDSSKYEYYYPVFSGSKDENSFLPIERGAWWLTRTQVDGLILCGLSNNVNIIEGYESEGEKTLFTCSIVDENSVTTKYNVAYTYNAIDDNREYYGDKVVVSNYLYGASLIADTGMNELVATKKRKLVIGDYDPQASEFYFQKEITTSQAGSIRPLCCCKVMYEGVVRDGFLYLKFYGSSGATATTAKPASVSLELYTSGVGVTDTLVSLEQNLKSVTVQNIVDADDNIVGCQIDAYKINWSAFSDDYQSVVEDEDAVLTENGTITKETITLNIDEGVCPYLEPLTNNGEVILDSYIPSYLPSQSLLPKKFPYALVRFSVDGVEI